MVRNMAGSRAGIPAGLPQTDKADKADDAGDVRCPQPGPNHVIASTMNLTETLRAPDPIMGGRLKTGWPSPEFQSCCRQATGCEKADEKTSVEPFPWIPGLSGRTNISTLPEQEVLHIEQSHRVVAAPLTAGLRDLGT